MKSDDEKMQKNIIEIIKKNIREQFTDENFELIDFELKGNRQKRLLRVYLDKKGGITLDDCEHFSKSLSVLLDVTDLIKTAYTLEVSSPGGRQRKYSIGG